MKNSLLINLIILFPIYCNQKSATINTATITDEKLIETVG